MGKWIEAKYRRGEYSCSECGEYSPKFERSWTEITYEGKEYDVTKLEPYLTPYCPFCGEKMSNGKE